MVSIESIKHQLVTIKELRNRLPAYAKLMLYKDLKGHRSQVFGRHRCLVVLYEGEINGTKQGHYVVLIRRHNHVEYFSSLGLGPQHEKHMLGLEKLGSFDKLLGKQFQYNRVKLQSDAYNINDCAWWCLARILLYKMKRREFVKFFSQKHSLQTSDDILALAIFISANTTPQKN